MITAALDSATLHRLMAWMSPAYPIGAFSYSSGTEWAIEAGDIADAASLGNWIESILVEGSGFCDAVLLAHAHRATSADDCEALRDVLELAAALTPGRERYLETTQQGRAFLEATRAAWPCAAIDRLATALHPITNGMPLPGAQPIGLAYPVAVGVATAGQGIALDLALTAFLQAIAANLVSAGVRLVPLGQTDGMRLVAGFEPLLVQLVTRVLKTSLDDIGGCTFRADLAGLRHETQYTRLFRS
jgi:urease accessory protein